MFYEVIPTQIFHKNSGFLTYTSPKNLQPGQIVQIPIGNKTSIGVIRKKITQKPNFKTKEIQNIFYEKPLPQHLLKAIEWLSAYYLYPLPTFASLLIPKGIEKKRRQTNITQIDNIAQKLPIIPLNTAQKIALEAILNANKGTQLLHGVTGSGKTNIYLQMALMSLKQQKSTILLAPEIALTSQLVQIFESTFGQKVILIHSKQTEAERHKIWEKLLNSETPHIIIGPRSALFAPINNLGLIIIDEAHESTYYQENPPKYSSIRLASFIAKTLNINCILGTATPLITDYYISKTKNSLIKLSEKAKSTAIEPQISIIDLKDKTNFTKNKYFSNQLLAEIDKNLKLHQQTLIFHNRRGSAPLTLCENCGWQALCPNCFLPFNLHSDTFQLICHSCGLQIKVPNCCPECNHTNIIHKGFGTKLLEVELKKIYKTAKIARFDADNKKNETLASLYDDVKNGKINIIIGTQTLTKGLDLPNLATVGIIQADSSLSLPDYESEERTFHLLTQVIGRVGRGHINSASVILQTFQPNNPIIKYSIKSDYEEFYNYSIKKRQEQNFPPFSFIVRLFITAKTEKTTITKINTLHSSLLKNSPKSIQISNPAPAFHEHTIAGYTWQIILKSKSRTTLQKTIEKIDPKFSAHIALDPPSLLQ